MRNYVVIVTQDIIRVKDKKKENAWKKESLKNEQRKKEYEIT